MNEWFLLIIAATVGSLVSLVGGLYLLYGKWGAEKLQSIAVPFAAGALLAAAFVDLLPEALHDSDEKSVMLAVLFAFLFFFVLERSLNWFHHHHEDDGHLHGRRNPLLVVVGDTLHNFIDGMAIGAAFLVSPATGIITAVAIAAHEIPQEIGDFGLLLSKGMSKRRVLMVNLVSALATVIGAALVFGFGGSLPISEPLLLAAVAGFFIYIAASDIVPTIHAEPSRRRANIQTIVLILGTIFVGVTTTLAHQYVDHGHDEPESSHVETAHDDEHDHDHDY